MTLLDAFTIGMFGGFGFSAGIVITVIVAAAIFVAILYWKIWRAK